MIEFFKSTRKWLYATLEPVWVASHWTIGHLRRLRSHVRRRWPGADPLVEMRDHAVYIHYDRKGVIHDYVVKQLEALIEAGFRITFVSNAPKFPQSNLDVIAPFCREIIWRRNVGYDFGGYKDGIAALGDLAQIDRLLLMNDSIYGPVWPLSEVLTEADPNKTDIWGITDSWQIHYHIQSYFILFFNGALASPYFQKFWRRLPYVNSKRWVIRYNEVRLTRTLTQQKLRAGVLSPYWDLARATLAALANRQKGLSKGHNEFLEELQEDIIQGRPLNPSHIFWETLLTRFHSPFLKREVITSNPVEIPFSWRWDEVIAQVSDYDVNLVRRHLQSL